MTSRPNDAGCTEEKRFSPARFHGRGKRAWPSTHMQKTSLGTHFLPELVRRRIWTAMAGPSKRSPSNVTRRLKGMPRSRGDLVRPSGPGGLGVRNGTGRRAETGEPRDGEKGASLRAREPVRLWASAREPQQKRPPGPATAGEPCGIRGVQGSGGGHERRCLPAAHAAVAHPAAAQRCAGEDRRWPRCHEVARRHAARRRSGMRENKGGGACFCGQSWRTNVPERNPALLKWYIERNKMTSKEGVDYAFNTPGPAHFGGCAARRIRALARRAGPLAGHRPRLPPRCWKFRNRRTVPICST